MNRVSLEQNLFTWGGWDDNGPGNLAFYDVELLVPIGDFPAGTKFSAAFWDGEHSFIAFYDEDENEHAFELKVTIGEKLQLPVSEKQEACGSCTCGLNH